MKKLEIVIVIMIVVMLSICYENTSMYLWFHSSNSLIEKLNKKQYNNIDFETLLPLIENENQHIYEDFLLDILKENEILDQPICKKCAFTITMTANEILNKKYKQKIRYISYYDILNQVERVNSNEYYYSMNEKYLKRLKELTKDSNTYYSSKEEILKIIHENNENSIKKWEQIIKK